MTVQLSYRAPYDWEGVLRFIRTRALVGVERVTDTDYARTVKLGRASGWIRVTHSPRKQALLLEYSDRLTPVLPALRSRIRALFDLDARPDLIAAHLAQDPRLSASVLANPGARVPGAFDGFELGLRAILGQQITVKAATTVACRLVAALGAPIPTPIEGLERLTPTANRIAAATVDDIARHGIVSARARCLIAFARAQRSGRLSLDGPARDPDEAMARLAALPGIGPWTAHYMAMRALHWSDAFPKEDVVVRKRLGNLTAKEVEALSQRWRPWRSYAVIHLWNMTGHAPLVPQSDHFAAPRR